MRLLLFCLTLIFFSCAKKSSSIVQNAKTNNSLDQTIEQILGSDFTQIESESKSFILAYQKNVQSSSFVKYVVVDSVSHKVIADGSFKPGYVKWKTDTSLEILSMPGMIPKEKSITDYIKIVNLPIIK